MDEYTVKKGLFTVKPELHFYIPLLILAFKVAVVGLAK
jgi:hypothetical protein